MVLPFDRPRRRSTVALMVILLVPLLNPPAHSESGPHAPRGPGSDPLPAAASATEVRDAVLALHRRVKSLRIVMDSSNSEQFDDVRLIHTVAAAKGPMRYYDLYHHTAGSLDQDPDSLIQVLHGGFDVYYPYLRKCEVSRKFAIRPYTVKILAATPFELLGWWPEDDPSSPPEIWGGPFFLKEALKGDRWRVRPLQEPASGRWCHVLEDPGRDALWVDAATGAVARREIRPADGKAQDTVVYEYDDFEDLKGGIVLPRLFRRRRPPPFSPVTYHHVVSYAVNDLDDGAFRIELPPGAIVVDRDTDTFRQVPGGLEFLDRVVERSRSLVIAGRRPPPAKPPWKLGGLFCLGLTLPALVGLAVGRHSGSTRRDREKREETPRGPTQRLDS